MHNHRKFTINELLAADPGIKRVEAINNDNEIRELLQFVTNNKVIPTQLAQIQPTDEALPELRLAIQLGDPSAAIFSDKRCPIYLLYSLINNTIPFWEGMTAYNYHLALQQFTNLVDLKPADQRFKAIRPLLVHSLHINSNEHDVGNLYPERVCAQIQEKLGITIDLEKFRLFISTLSPVNAWVIEVQDPFVDMTTANEDDSANDDLFSVDYLKTRLVANIPFLVKTHCEGKADSYLYPSFALIQYCLNQVSPQPMRMMPIFNSVGCNTLYELHKKNVHPIPLYSIFVRDNLLSVHDSRSGCFFNVVHDIGHTFWASMLTFEERNTLLNEIIPSIQQMTHPKKDKALEQLNDFDLTPVKQYQDAKERFKLYLLKRIPASIMIDSASHLNKFNLFKVIMQPAPTPAPQKSTCTLI